ncbi:MAG: cytochrome c-type biogenesis CcmF C-terminal domain-containing protein [Acidimicrobiia bacterium]
MHRGGDGGGRDAADLTGPGALAVALACSVAAAALAVTGLRGPNVVTGLRGPTARRLVGVAAAALTVAVVTLAAALLRGDWSLVYVADYTSRDTPWPYRLAALWGGMEGSLLVWGWVLSLWAVAAARWARPWAPAVTAVPAAVLAVVAGLLLWAASPFDRLEVPAIDGGGLTPVLRHPAMLYHPVLLYAGQAGLVVPFALALGARAAGLAAGEWVPAARRWMLGSLAVLAVAVVAGAHWAYVNLGWGGYWAWDPVENAALLPWVAGVAFLHLARRSGAGSGGGAGPARMAALTFGLALGGAILTRSGGTGSVHAFAEAGTVGVVLGGLLAAVVAAVVVVEWRAPRSVPSTGGDVYVLAAALLGGVVAVVGAGTVLPLVGDDGSLVAGRYFAVTALPFGLALLALAGVGPRWRGRSTPPGRFLPALAGVPAAMAAAGVGGRPLVVLGAGLGGATAGLTVAEVAERGWAWRRCGGLVAHLGMAVLLVGVLATSAATRERGVLGPGQDMAVAGYTLRLAAVTPADAEGPGAAVTATVAVERGGERVATLRPKAMLSGAGQRVSVSGLRSTLLEDLQVTLRAVGPQGDGAVVDVAVTPLVQWVWWGGLLVAVGLALSVASGGFTPIGPGVGEAQSTREVQWTP